MKIDLSNIVWAAIASAALNIIAVFTASTNPDLALVVALGGVSSAILALRE